MVQKVGSIGVFVLIYWKIYTNGIVKTSYFSADKDDDDHKEPDGQGSNCGIKSNKDLIDDGKSWQKYEMRLDDEACGLAACFSLAEVIVHRNRVMANLKDV